MVEVLALEFIIKSYLTTTATQGYMGKVMSRFTSFRILIQWDTAMNGELAEHCV